MEYTLAGMDVLLHRIGWSVQVPARPGCRPRLIYCTHRARRGDKRKGFTETDCARFLEAAHQQPADPIVRQRP